MRYGGIGGWVGVVVTQHLKDGTQSRRREYNSHTMFIPPSKFVDFQYENTTEENIIEQYMSTSLKTRC